MMYNWNQAKGYVLIVGLGPRPIIAAAQLGEESTEFGEHKMYLVTYRRSAWATPGLV